MNKAEFEESRTFNLAELLDYGSNAIVTKNIKVQKGCVIQVLVFDYGKVKLYKKSSVSRFIYIIEGKAEVVLDENSTFLKQGDSILIPRQTAFSIEANERFKMIVTSIESE
ncbi:cupin domain-containing protein [Pareuzebyella sediminis]|uniref:cupin domain-containing protein n=1 Tax=Pareuzebyella sediminis TaxID=2607998 RepID=UPI0011EBD3F4|nr:cupin domain-containing protein [Pareuzebyella sediminis]